jgi:hypothetical protein
MVRYSEIIKEDKKKYSKEEIMNFLNKFYVINGSSEIIKYDPDKNEIDFMVDGTLTVHETTKLLPFTLHTLIAPRIACSSRYLTKLINMPKFCYTTLRCIENELTSFDGIPLGITELFIQDNQLRSLEGLPNTLGILDCSDNPLETLAGLENSKEIYALRLSYDPNLPLLRTLSLTDKNAKIIFPGGEGSLKGQQVVEEILNHHIKTYPNIKERIYKCQYALIKAGYKGNAKW